MAQTKKKNAQSLKAKIKTVERVKEQSKAQSQLLSDVSKIWNQECEALVSREFETVDQAIEALIETVLEKSKAGQGREDERDFLKLVFAEDPDLRETLSGILNIK